MQDKNDIAKYLQNLARRISVTKIVATRSLRTPHGDYFLAYSGAYDSHQCDYGGPGADAVPDSTDDRETAESGVSLADAKLVKMLLAREVDLGVLDSARLGGGITLQEYEVQHGAITQRYNQEIGREISRVLKDKAPTEGTKHVGS